MLEMIRFSIELECHFKLILRQSMYLANLRGLRQHSHAENNSAFKLAKYTLFLKRNATEDVNNIKSICKILSLGGTLSLYLITTTTGNPHYKFTSPED